MTQNEKKQLYEAIKNRSDEVLELNKDLRIGLIDPVTAYSQLGKCFTGLINDIAKIAREN